MKAELERDGFARWPGRLDRAALRELADVFAGLAADRPGARIDPAACAALAAYRAVRDDLCALLGPLARPVRALLFDKHAGANWALAWHQDRTIEVAERIDVPGYGPWTVKQGRVHAAPPLALLERMVTVRIHLDPVPQDNAPLLVVPGSHRMGFVAESAIPGIVARQGTAVCLADAGAIWIYVTPILHGSARSAEGQRRRVLQMDVSADDLPGGLRWAADGARWALEGDGTLA